ncbi:MAG: sulfatase-like hydrolase/transferase [Bryobacteraceae bacterium]
MHRRQFLRSSAAALAAPVLGAAGRRPPNFLVILADDLGAKELGCYGNTRHRTPHLDALARTGVQFRTAYATPLCHPTRVELLTGQYGCHSGVYNFAGMRGGPERDSPAEDIGRNHVTFAEVLKTRGYATAISGKWQLSGTLPDLIHECGFDEYSIWALRNHVAPEDMPLFRERARYWQPSISRNGRLMRTTVNDYGPDIFTDCLADFMRRKRAQPFLAYLTMPLTHSPHVPTPDTVKPGVDKDANSAKNFPACLEYLDKLVGRLVKALEDSGLRENTIIIFTSDNGTGGDGKAQATELGARVPLIVNCPGVVKPRGASDELADLSDILPTLAEFAGAELPRDKVIDGRSLAGYLRGDGAAPRDWIFSFVADRRILRTKRWLLEDNSPLHYGRLYDCGSSRDGAGYREVTASRGAEVLAARARFDELLKGLPAPYIPEEGDPNQRKQPRQERRKRKNR